MTYEIELINDGGGVALIGHSTQARKVADPPRDC